MTDTPQLDKLAAFADHSRAIDEFYDWLTSRGLTIAAPVGDQLAPVPVPIHQLIADHIGVDLVAAEQERLALVKDSASALFTPLREETHDDDTSPAPATGTVAVAESGTGYSAVYLSLVGGQERDFVVTNAVRDRLLAGMRSPAGPAVEFVTEDGGHLAISRASIAALAVGGLRQFWTLRTDTAADADEWAHYHRSATMTASFSPRLNRTNYRAAGSITKPPGQLEELRAALLAAGRPAEYVTD